MDIPRPPTPVQSLRGFQVRHGAFTYRGIQPEQASRLNELFNHESLRLDRSQKATIEAARRMIRKPWFEAQLKLYGIDFSTGATKADLERILKDAVKSGRCNQVPAEIRTIENDLRAQYREPYARYKTELAQWEKRIDDSRKDAYHSQPTASAKADYDIELFMKQYFLDGKGRPEPKKTPEPMALPGVDRAAVHARAERVLGLHTASGGHGEGRTLVIGWNRSAVFSKAIRIGDEDTRRVKTQRNDAWEQKMMKHKKLVSDLATRQDGGEWDTFQCRGSYAIQCEALENGWDCDKSKFRLRIAILAGFKLVGQFDFEAVEGVMHLADDPGALPHSQQDGTMSDDESDEDDDEDTDSEDAFNRDTKKRKTNVAPAPQAGRPRKRQKRSGSTRRVHFVWRGRETGEGEIENGKDQVGYMDFKDDSGSCFEGRIMIPFCGDVQFEGFKVGSLGGPIRDTWSDYSDAQYEYERVARWR